MKTISILCLLLSSIVTSSQNRSDLNPALAPFYHGVASGDPTATSVIIWTRLTTTDPGATVTWRIALDTAMLSIVTTGTVQAPAPVNW